jgi:3-(3-hydroxy-phenyl)propionate hydroxylase
MALGRSVYDEFPSYPFRRPPEIDGAAPRHPVAIVGGGPVGLTLALGLARRGVPSVVIEPRDAVSFGSRAACISRRSLEIWEHLGIAERPLATGLPWTGGRSFWRDNRLVLDFAMPHDADQKHPPMINLQQCYAEQYLVDAIHDGAPQVDLRWRSEVVGVEPRGDAVRLRVATPQGDYELAADYVVACDGARSVVRTALGLRLEGTSYEGRYLIADIRLRTDHPTERRAWFDPPSNPGSTMLMHKQPGDLWRIDYQLRDDEDAEAEQDETRVRARIDAHLRMIGERLDYELVWSSLYKAHCLTLDSYRHGNVLFAGDAAHLVPIFGVRGLNSGIDDAANLAWKLAAVIENRGGDALLDSYSDERVFAAQENIRQARKSTLFMTPPSAGFTLMREAALSLAVAHSFARPLLNPRQTSAITFPDSPLSTPDRETWPNGIAVGATLPTCKVTLRRGNARRSGHLLDAMGRDATALLFVGPAGLASGDDRALAAASERWKLEIVLVAANGAAHPRFTSVEDSAGRAAALLSGAEGVGYLVRPDGHVAARWQQFDPTRLETALARIYAAAQ